MRPRVAVTSITTSSRLKRWLLFAGVCLVGLAFLLAVPAQTEQERDLQPLATKRVQPDYPPLAHKYRLQGEVRVRLVVSGEGKVEEAEFIKGHNIFRAVSLDAAKRWHFKQDNEGKGYRGYITFVFQARSGD